MAIKDKRIRGQGFCGTNAELAEKLTQISDAGADAYFACSTFKDPSVDTPRGQKNVQAAKSFWLDVDAGKGKPYPDAEAARNAVIKFAFDAGLPSPTLVCSGYGVHAYFVLEEAISGEAWAQGARGLKALVDAHGLHVDPSRTKDGASILRPLETLNYKNPAEPRDVYLMQGVTSYANATIMDTLNQTGLSPIPEKTGAGDALAANILGGLSRSFPETPSSAELASKHCRQLALFRSSFGNVDEPNWYANLGVLAHCTDGEDLAQQWSSGHPDYNADETHRKLSQARDRAGPTTCERFKQINPTGCQGCPHNVTSPIQLGKSEAVVTPPYIGDEDKETIPPLPENFHYGSNKQIMCRVKDRDADPGENDYIDVLVCEFPFYVASVRKQETHGALGEQSVKIMARTTHSPWEGFTINRETLMGPGWLGAMAKFGVVCEPGTEKHFRVLIHRMIKWKAQSGVMEMSYKSFGWKDERTGFVSGRKLYTKDGIKEVSGTQEFEKAADLLGPKKKGSLNKWRAAANRVFAEGCEPQAFAMLCSFAAPLMDLLYADDEGGTIVSLVSAKGGQGKTAAILAAETVWGQTNCLRITEKESSAAKFRAIGIRCNLPVVIDEWGGADIDVVRDNVATFTGGLDKKRLTQAAEDIREQLHWKTVLIGTTNLPLVDRLCEAHYRPQAARIFEVPLAIPEHLAKTQTADLNQEFEANAGFAGPVFLLHLLKHHDLEVLKVKANNLAEEFGKQLGASTEERFKTRLVAAVAIASLILTKKMENGESLLEFSPARVVNWALKVIKDGMKENHGRSSPEKNLMDFIRDNMHNFVVVQGPYNPQRPYIDVVLPKQKLMGRYERESMKLYVPHDIIRKFATSVRVPYSEFAKDLTAMHLVLNRNRQTVLTAGVDDMAPMRTSCWEIDLSHEAASDMALTLSTGETKVNDKLAK